MNHLNPSQTSAAPQQLPAKPPAKTPLKIGVLATGLLLTLALASASHAQIRYGVGQINDKTKFAAPKFASFPTGYEAQNSYGSLPRILPQQNYAPQTYASFPSTAPAASRPAPTAPTPTGNVQPGLAQQKAERAARQGLRGHVGGSLGGAKYEGVGWSNHSAQNAIHSCCYWGTRPTSQIGITKGNDGFWYACVLYH